MQVATKVIFNTIVIYIKIILSLSIALVSIPLILKALGADDYGLYNLVAGVVAMLAFLNNSMTVSSQRYMSVAMGTNDRERVNNIYNCSFVLHLLLALVVVLALECGSFYLNKLNINPDRQIAAQIIYQLLIFSMFFKIITVPYNAIINAHEDMLAFAVIEIVDSILMLLTAVFLKYVLSDKLVFYGLSVALISLLTYCMKYVWCKLKYRDYRIQIYRKWNKSQLQEMLGFAGWNLFGGLAIIGRNQGVAVIINLFLGTIANAAYGIANQINGALGHFSATFQSAVNPQLMKSEGMDNRERMLRISYILSKFSVLSMAFFAIPLVLEMNEVLSLWLKDSRPPYTQKLAQLILLLSITYQCSVGIMSAVQASGKIRNYHIIISVILLTNVPISYMLLKIGYPIYYIMYAFIAMECISLFVRLLIARKLVNLSLSKFMREVISPCLIVIGIPAIMAYILHITLPAGFIRLLIVSASYGILFLTLTWYFAIDENYRIMIKQKIHKLQLKYRLI